jgi:hypothetical protein
MTDRRTYFFLGAGILVLLIEPLIPQYGWLTMVTGVVYLALAGLFGGVSIAQNRASRRNGHAPTTDIAHPGTDPHAAS